MDIDYQVREFQVGDTKSTLDLLCLVFKDWPGFNVRDTMGYYRWKYFDNPLKGNSITIAEHLNQIVGCDHGYFRKVKIMDSLYLMHFGGDLAVHPDYRRMGIYGKLQGLQEQVRQREGVDVYLGATTNPIVLEMRRKKGFLPFPKKILEMLYLYDPFKEKISLYKSIGYLFYKKYRKALDTQPVNLNKTTIQEVKNFDKEADLFWEKIRNDYDFIMKRDKDNLNWRYCDPRTAPYRILTVMDDDELLGYTVVVTREQNNKPVTFIVDLCVLNSDPVVIRQLVNQVLHLYRNEVNVVKYMVIDGHPNVSVLSSLGFMSRDTVWGITCVEKKEQVKTDLLKIRDVTPGRLLLQYGDSDIL